MQQLQRTQLEEIINDEVGMSTEKYYFFLEGVERSMTDTTTSNDD